MTRRHPQDEDDGGGDRAVEGADPLVVPFKIARDGALHAALVRALVKYLLYLRGQIPCVYDELQGLVTDQREKETAEKLAGSRKRKLLTRQPLRHAEKLLTTADELLGRSLSALFTRRIHTVVLVLGASVASPREVWQIEFHAASPANADSSGIPTPSDMPRNRVERLCVQKLIRMVLMYTAEQFASALPVTTMHVLVLGEANADEPIRGFVPKQNFRLRLPKPKRGVRRSHIIQICDQASVAVSPSPKIAEVSRSPSGNGEDLCGETGDPRGDATKGSGRVYDACHRQMPMATPPLIWFQSQHALRGFTGLL